MEIVTQIIQILLCGVFGMIGLTKLLRPYETLVTQFAWMESVSPTIVKIIGILEILGAIGIVVPTALSIFPFFTPLAGIGLTLLMIGAIITHAMRREYMNIFSNIVLLGLIVFVAAYYSDLLFLGFTVQ